MELPEPPDELLAVGLGVGEVEEERLLVAC
jgi:hypothetical protein